MNKSSRLNVKNIIDENDIFNTLKETRNSTKENILKILRKAGQKKGLSLKEAGSLLNVENPKLIETMFEAAGKIKKEIYGERLVFFAPFYISSYCINDCEYCGFHFRNRAPRKKLTRKEVIEQVEILENMGHKRLLLEFGEHPTENPIDYVVDVIKTIYSAKSGKGAIRRVNVNIAATTVENYKKLKKAGIGTYQLFQETYHRPTYENVHTGLKRDYERQLFAHDRAISAGIDDFGLGVLFGLYDYKFEVLGLLSHARYLNKKYEIGPHTISVPRFQPADTVAWTKAPHQVSESELLKIIAILRMAVPYTGMIISTRESPEIRAKAFKIGISQTSAGSQTAVGGYNKKTQKSKINVSQFHVQDERNLDEVLKSALRQGLLPSFCTACYRRGRTGKTFMKIAKHGDIQRLCRPNAILTLKEYLEDYASKKVKQMGEKTISNYIEKIDDNNLRAQTKIRLERIENGERDIYF